MWPLAGLQPPAQSQVEFVYICFSLLRDHCQSVFHNELGSCRLLAAGRIALISNSPLLSSPSCPLCCRCCFAFSKSPGVSSGAALTSGCRGSEVPYLQLIKRVSEVHSTLLLQWRAVEWWSGRGGPMKGGRRCLWFWLALLQPVAVSSLVMTSVSQVIFRLQHHCDELLYVFLVNRLHA